MQEIDLIKILIVDDELAGRRILKTYLEKYCHGVLIVGVASNAKEAAEIVARKNPELVLLDIEMPGENGISFLERYSKIPFDVIFTTAYEKYALKAFELSAIHYLLKPIKLEELQAALKKYRTSRNNKENQANLNKFLRQLQIQDQNKTGRIAIHTA
ncbi:MAG: response regulator, partial [Bacteroidia bacterium]|nr:response regulator [Bacteroidia bacterium]